MDRLKPGAPFLVYLYYRLEDAGLGRRLTLRMVTLLRYVVARLPRRLKGPVTDCIAVLVYFPLARMAALVEKMGGDPSHIPLFQYRGRSFYVMRNDALDRFGTRLEKRFSQAEIMTLLTKRAWTTSSSLKIHRGGSRSVIDHRVQKTDELFLASPWDFASLDARRTARGDDGGGVCPSHFSLRSARCRGSER
ncbi:MAG: hypothetical protein CM1200mP26_26840 [Acidimicrobiales bacterium]|nr:MAG: hypothetical protein CM1200mP26_26840 [Acidimicrobiales bacterium]